MNMLNKLKSNINSKSVKKPRILVILGATATGKTKLALRLARKYGGEIISADSRQVYKGMDIGTGKDLAEYGKGKNVVRHHLIDVVSPKKEFDLAMFQELANKAIEDVIKRKKIPIIVGGSGLYLQSLIDNFDLTSNRFSRQEKDSLELLGAEDLFKKIKKINPIFASKINNSDKCNARRLARYLQIVKNGGTIDRREESPYDYSILGLSFSDEVLRQRVSYRLLKRFEEGMIAEVKQLKDSGLSDKRFDAFGLEYKYINNYLNGMYSYQEMVRLLETASYRFAKRQKTWFRRMEKQGWHIEWIEDADRQVDEIEKMIEIGLDIKKTSKK